MAKFAGKVGFVTTAENPDRPGIWEPSVIERMYYGDVTRNYRKWSSGDSTNDNLSLSNEISIISDPFLTENFQDIRYVTYQNASWTVTNIEIQFPRVILTIGGVYNVEQS